MVKHKSADMYVGRPKKVRRNSRKTTKSRSILPRYSNIMDKLRGYRFILFYGHEQIVIMHRVYSLKLANIQYLWSKYNVRPTTSKPAASLIVTCAGVQMPHAVNVVRAVTSADCTSACKKHNHIMRCSHWQDSRLVAHTLPCHVGNLVPEDISCETCTNDLGVAHRCSRRDMTSCWDINRAYDIACLHKST